MISKDALNLIWVKALQGFMPSDYTVVIQEETIGENRPKPAKPYVQVNLISGPVDQGSDEELRCDNGVFLLSSIRQLTVSLQAFGQGGFDSLALFKTKLFDYSSHIQNNEVVHGLGSFLKQNGISIVERGTIQNVSALLGTGIEQRHNMDIIFNIASNVEVTIDTVKSVRISGTINKEDGTSNDISTQVDKP